jgi:hypothetical protein
MRCLIIAKNMNYTAVTYHKFMSFQVHISIKAGGGSIKAGGGISVDFLPFSLPYLILTYLLFFLAYLRVGLSNLV